MEKIFILTALTFLITTGTAAVMTVHPHLAMACNTARLLTASRRLS